MTTSPPASVQGIAKLTAYFENGNLYKGTLPLANFFYIDNKVNFGYGINLTDAAVGIAKGGTTEPHAVLRAEINPVLAELGVTITTSEWIGLKTPGTFMLSDLIKQIAAGTTFSEMRLR